MLRLAMSLAVLACAVACATLRREMPLVCRVAADRAAFAGQTLTLEGRLFSDFHHGSGVTHDVCLDTHVPLGYALPGEQGGQAFYEAWRASASCPHDPLYFTVTGILEQTEQSGRIYLALRPASFRNIRRDGGSSCPITLQGMLDRADHR